MGPGGGLASGSQVNLTALHMPDKLYPSCTILAIAHKARAPTNMAEPEKDLEKLRQEQAKEDADLLADLDKESKEFDKVLRHSSICLGTRQD